MDPRRALQLERTIYFRIGDKDSLTKAMAALAAYRESRQQYGEAIRRYATLASEAERSRTADSADYWRLAQVNCYMALGQETAAVQLLDNMSQGRYAAAGAKARALIAIINHNEKDLAHALKQYTSLKPAGGHRADSLERAYLRAKKQYAALPYALCSAVLPGSGQLLLGFPRPGLNSTAVVGGLGFAFVVAARLYNPYVALISAGPWLLKYYTAGIETTVQLARYKRKKAIYNVYIAVKNLPD